MSIQKSIEPKSMACGLRSDDTSNLVSWLKVSVSLRLSQHHHNEQWSPVVLGQGKSVTIAVARSSIGDRLKTLQRGENGNNKWPVEPIRVLSPWGSWGAVRRTIQRDENFR